MNAQDRKDMAEFIATLKNEFAAALQPLIEKHTELEQRSSNFAARVNSHNACYRAEIAALREEVVALKAGKKFTQVAERISPTAWKTAVADLARLTPGKTYFPAAMVREHAARLAAAPTVVPPLVGYTEGDPLLEESDEDEFSM